MNINILFTNDVVTSIIKNIDKYLPKTAEYIASLSNERKVHHILKVNQKTDDVDVEFGTITTQELYEFDVSCMADLQQIDVLKLEGQAKSKNGLMLFLDIIENNINNQLRETYGNILSLTRN